jgi:drug/metabolite transporter (DMT)-like permease
VAEIAIVTMGLVIVGAVFIAAHLPRSVPLGLPIGLTILAAAMLAANVVILRRARDFDWATFLLVARYSLLAYIVIAGMLEFVFLHNHTPGNVMVLLSAMLAIYAVDIPLLFGFSVARYQQVK